MNHFENQREKLEFENEQLRQDNKKMLQTLDEKSIQNKKVNEGFGLQ